MQVPWRWYSVARRRQRWPRLRLGRGRPTATARQIAGDTSDLRPDVFSYWALRAGQNVNPCFTKAGNWRGAIGRSIASIGRWVLTYRIQAWCCIFLATTGASGSVSAQPSNPTAPTTFQIAGTVSSSYKDGKGQSLLPFSIEIGDCNRWILHMTNGIADYEAVACDGKDCYHLCCIRSAVETMLRTQKNMPLPVQKGRTNIDNIATANVMKGLVPHYPSPPTLCAGAVWLTYASGCYFRNVTNGWVEPAVSVGVPSPRGYDVYPEDFVLKMAVVTKGYNALGVPERVDYLEEGFRPVDKKPYPSPFDAGFTNTIFEIADTTNWNGMAFPLAARMRTYGVETSSNGVGCLRLWHDYEVRTESITLVTPRTDYRPAIPGVTAIYDDRFTRKLGNGFGYTGTNWLTEREALNSQEYKRAAMAAGKWPVKIPPFFTLAFLCLLLLPPFFYLTRRWQRPGAGK